MYEVTVNAVMHVRGVGQPRPPATTDSPQLDPSARSRGLPAVRLTRGCDLTNTVGQMALQAALGQFEQLLLTAILTLEDDAYGVTIHARVTELAAPRRVSIGAVYVTLDRLEDKGLIRSWMSGPTAARGGRAKRCFRLKAAGERALRESAGSIRRLHEALSTAWGTI